MKLSTVHRCLVSCCILLPLVAGMTVASTGGKDFFIAPSGNDSWSGKLSAPNSTNTDGPFRTFAGARDAIRAMKSKGALSGGATLNVRGGKYTMYDTFRLSADDSGTSSRPMTWRAYRGEKVTVSGGRKISGFTPVTDPAIRARLGSAATHHVLVTDLR